MTPPQGFDHRTLRAIAITFPVIFLVVAALKGSWTTAIPLSLYCCLIALLFILRRGRSHSVTLHLVVLVLVVYQTLLLRSTTDEPNLGIVWHLTLPALVALLGNRLHILIWTPVSVGLVLYTWHLYADYPAYAHPLTPWNLAGAALLIGCAGLGITFERDRRQKQLQRALGAARQEALNRKVAQRKANDANDATKRFLGSISHELRTPLTSIVMSTEVLDRELEQPELTRWTRNIRESAQSLVLLLDDVLELARSDADAITLNDRAFDVDALMDSVIAIIQPMAAARDVSLLVGAEPDVPVVWQGDDARIRQVLINLLNNALQHSNGSQVGLLTSRDEDRIRFEVIDDGRGIAADAQDAIFVPFQQLKESGDEPAGTGLGLAISRSYVTAMGGELSVSSRPGEGATFGFSLPAPIVDATTLANRHARAPDWPAAVRIDSACPVASAWIGRWFSAWGLVSTPDAPALDLPHDPIDPVISLARVRQQLDTLGQCVRHSTPAAGVDASAMPAARCLICDDDTMINESLCTILRMHGHAADGFVTGREALAALRESAYDVVILDLNLGPDSGLELLRDIRQLPPPVASIPVCILSGSWNQREASFAAGANDYLRKPCNSEGLLEMVGRLAHRASPSDEIRSQSL